MRKIRKGDEVIVLAGKDKGKRGRVLRIVADKRAYVEGINLIKKHTKPNPQRNQQGGIVSKEAAIDLSNLAVFNSDSGKADRVGFKFLEDGTKVRYYKSSGEVIDV